MYRSRFGPVQSVRLLGHEEGQEGSVCAAVAFVDIRSAAKAFAVTDHRLEERTLRTDYYEPGLGSRAPACPSSTLGQLSTNSAVNGGGGGGGVATPLNSPATGLLSPRPRYLSR
jgi:hypothetical protein